MMTRSRAVYLALFLTLSLSLGACSGGDTGAASDNNRANENQQQIHAQQTIPTPRRDADDNAVAKRLEALAKSVPVKVFVSEAIS